MEFFTSAVSTPQTIVIALGVGLAVWGVINLLEGYGSDNPAQTCAGCEHDGISKGGQYLGGKICPCYGCRRNPNTPDAYVRKPENENA